MALVAEMPQRAAGLEALAAQVGVVDAGLEALAAQVSVWDRQLLQLRQEFEQRLERSAAGGLPDGAQASDAPEPAALAEVRGDLEAVRVAVDSDKASRAAEQRQLLQDVCDLRVALEVEVGKRAAADADVDASVRALREEAQDRDIAFTKALAQRAKREEVAQDVDAAKFRLCQHVDDALEAAHQGSSQWLRSLDERTALLEDRVAATPRTSRGPGADGALRAELQELRTRCANNEQVYVDLRKVLEDIVGGDGRSGGLANIAERLDYVTTAVGELDISVQEGLDRERRERERGEAALTQQLAQLSGERSDAARLESELEALRWRAGPASGAADAAGRGRGDSTSPSPCGARGRAGAERRCMPVALAFTPSSASAAPRYEACTPTAASAAQREASTPSAVARCVAAAQCWSPGPGDARQPLLSARPSASAAAPVGRAMGAPGDAAPRTARSSAPIFPARASSPVVRVRSGAPCLIHAACTASPASKLQRHPGAALVGPAGGACGAALPGQAGSLRVPLGGSSGA